MLKFVLMAFSATAIVGMVIAVLYAAGVEKVVYAVDLIKEKAAAVIAYVKSLFLDRIE